MLREILTTGFKDKNVKLQNKRMFSPGKSSDKIMNKNQSYKSFNYSSNKKNQKDILNKNNTIPIMKNKIEMIMNRPDYLIGQNNESTMPTNSINKQYIYSNEITKNMISPANIENLNINDFKSPKNENTTEVKKYKNTNKNINKNMNNNNINKNTNANQIDNIIIKEKKNNDINNIFNERNIITKEINNINQDININNENNNIIVTNSQSKLKPDNSKSFELNMSLLSAEGIDKIKLLEEYIAQIKNNSTNINEIKLQQLQKQKNKLESNVNILSNNIRLNKKKYKDNLKLKKNLEFEKERVQYDSSKADKDAFSLLKELPNNRVEIEIMKNKIAQAREETKGIINYTNDIERQIMEIQDELKKINVKITNSIKEKDKISSEINTIHKKCSTLRSKIDKAEKSANEFLYSVGQLAKLTQQNNI